MHERLEQLDDELFHLDEAIEHLKHVPDCEDITEYLEGLRRTTALQRKIEHMRIEIMDGIDDNDLRREYEEATL